MRIVVPDRYGLVCAFELPTGIALGSDAPSRTLGEAPVWLHFNLADSRARHWLSTASGVPTAAVSVLLDPHPRVRLQLLPEALVAIVSDVHHDFHGDPEGFGEFRIYADASRIITGRRHPLKTADQMKRAFETGTTAASTLAWLGEFTRRLAATLGSLVDEVVEQTDQIEDDIVAGQGQARRAALADIRRLLVRVRRHVHANRAALSKLHTARASESEQATLRRAVEGLDGVAQDMDLVHERVRLLQDELAGLLAEATNRNLYVLSIVTTVLLPTTLITGLWGVNVGGLPWADDPNGFWYTLSLVFGSVVGCLLVLRRSRVV